MLKNKKTQNKKIKQNKNKQTKLLLTTGLDKELRFGEGRKKGSLAL